MRQSAVGFLILDGAHFNIHFYVSVLPSFSAFLPTLLSYPFLFPILPNICAKNKECDTNTFCSPSSFVSAYVLSSNLLVSNSRFQAIPFLLELRSILDWVCTDTTLTLYHWLKMEDIYANIYVLKCYRESEKVNLRCASHSSNFRIIFISICQTSDFSCALIGYSSPGYLLISTGLQNTMEARTVPLSFDW